MQGNTSRLDRTCASKASQHKVESGTMDSADSILIGRRAYVRRFSPGRWRVSLTLAIVFFLTPTIAHARWCNSPYCAMCNAMFGPMPGYSSIGIRTVAEPIIQSTPQIVVEAMLAEARLTRSDLLYDLGCGDGRIVVTAAKLYHCKAVGIEIDPAVAAVARRKLRQSGARGVLIHTGDARKLLLEQATVVTMYLSTELMRELVPRLKARVIVSYSHPVPGYDNRMVMVAGKYPIYVVDFTLEQVTFPH